MKLRSIVLAALITLAGSSLMLDPGRAEAACPELGAVGEKPSEVRNWDIEGTAASDGSSQASVDKVTVIVDVSAGDSALNTAHAIEAALAAELDLDFYSVDVCELFSGEIMVTVERFDGIIELFEPPEFDGQNIQEALSLDVADIDEPNMAQKSGLTVISRLLESKVEFSVQIDVDSKVQLKVFDINGRRLTVLADEFLLAGDHTFVWNLYAKGQKVPAGVYFGAVFTTHAMAIERVVIYGR